MKKIKLLLLSLFTFAALLFLPLTAVSASANDYVIDETGILTQSQVQELNHKAQQISESHDVGVYIRVANSMYGYYDMQSFTEALYTSEGLGLGSDGETGILLAISMEDREYYYATKGPKAFSTFTDYVDSDPEAKDSRRGLAAAITFTVPEIIALFTCFGMKSKMKTTGIKQTATNYIPSGGIRLTKQLDQFTHRTETRIPINRDHSGGGGGGGTTIHSSGFGGHGGKF